MMGFDLLIKKKVLQLQRYRLLAYSKRERPQVLITRDSVCDSALASIKLGSRQSEHRTCTLKLP